MSKPEKRFRCGAIEASVFENTVNQQGRQIKIKKVAFQKRYKSSDGSWKSTNSLDVHELPKAILALSLAYEYIVLSPDASEDKDPLEKTLGE